MITLIQYIAVNTSMFGLDTKVNKNNKCAQIKMLQVLFADLVQACFAKLYGFWYSDGDCVLTGYSH